MTNKFSIDIPIIINKDNVIGVSHSRKVITSSFAPCGTTTSNVDPFSLRGTRDVGLLSLRSTRDVGLLNFGGLLCLGSLLCLRGPSISHEGLLLLLLNETNTTSPLFGRDKSSGGAWSNSLGWQMG